MKTIEEAKEQRRQHYLKNRDRLLAKQAAYLANPENRALNRTRCAKRYAANKGLDNLFKRAAYRDNPEFRERARLASIRWYAANKERHKANGLAYRARPGMAEKLDAAAENRRRERMYGVTPEQVEQMKVAQNHSCAICFRVCKLVIDHNHTTGKVRALLCNPCNSAIGLLQESLTVLESAKAYLQKHITS